MDTVLPHMSSFEVPKSKPSRSIVERSISFLLLALIFIFALNSIGNVQKYVAQFHAHWTGSALGMAFGTVVFVCAYIAATTHGRTRWVSIVIGTIFGIASAQFQTELYTSEGMALQTARALSYIPILAGEVGLALLESLYSKQHQEEETAQEVAMLQQLLHEKEASIAALQDENQQRQQHSASLEAALEEATQQSQLPHSASEVTANGQMHPANPPVSTATTPQSLLPNAGDLHAANDARTAMKAQRKAAIPQLLADPQTALSTGELAQKLQQVYNWQLSTDSVRRYCQELATDGIVENVSRKWQLCTSQ